LTDTVATCSRNEDELVRAARAGDASAFDALVGLLGASVYRFVRARVPDADAEDLTQRVFVRVIEGLPGYQDRGLPFSAWVFRIARNVVVDAGRARRDHLSLDAAAAVSSPLPGPAELVESAADRGQLTRALARLPSDQRDVITYRYFADLSTRDIATAIGKHEGTVRVLQFRALRNLRRLLAPYEDLRLGMQLAKAES
jgi:RNA polymerase sigma-70 factor (ECF subfamily)